MGLFYRLENTMDTTQAWLLLTQTKGLGTARIKMLLDYYNDASAIFKQRHFPNELKIPQAVQQSLKNPDFDTIKQDLYWLEKEGNSVLTLNDDLYPPLLKQTDSPPPLLYITGNPQVLLQAQLAVVGSRNASAVGLKNTHAFCYDLAKNGLVITSGMALGVDGAAHAAALKANGITIAVMGTGLDSVYPPRHRDLAHQIAEKGALVSEFAIGTKPNAYNFPRRNRIICGLSLGTLVMEASVKSGTLITARQTMEINRPVMAIPGSIHSPMVKGCHLLIKQGAKLVESAQEILEELTPLAASLSMQIKQKLANLDSNTEAKNEAITDTLQENEEISSQHQRVLECIQYEATSLETIMQKSACNAQEIASILLILELENKIQTMPGAHYIRI